MGFCDGTFLIKNIILKSKKGEEKMPQIQLPIFPEGMTHITYDIGFIKRDGKITYFIGHLPIFIHDEKDIQTFRMITSQFIATGTAGPSDVAKALGVPGRTVKRYAALYRKKGTPGFYEKPARRGAAVITDEIVVKAQGLLDECKELSEISKIIGIKANTLSKAIRAGKLHRSIKKNTHTPEKLSTKSERSVEDNKSLMGVGATNILARVSASLGITTGTAIEFQPCADVPYGGVLFALPALLANKLLTHTKKYFSLPKGYYNIESIFLILGFLALARIKEMESLRYCAPGEWGKLLGIDRIPEVKTMREKINILSSNDGGKTWSAELCKEWMEETCGTEYEGYYYIDGHVKIYYGAQTLLPKHYVSRERLCMRATVDYWVNAMGGAPFFLITKAIDPGLIQVLKNDIIPRLEKEVPNQPTEEQLKSNKDLHRFTILFDREGYSPDFLKDMREKGIACITYNKYPGEDWEISEFKDYILKLVGGENVVMKLAERRIKLKNDLCVREIRKLTDSGHQTSVLTTDYITDFKPVAAAMFARWCQEAYFKYMINQFNLDRLMTYQLEDIPDTTLVVNPEFRQVDSQTKSKISKLDRKLKEFGAITLTDEIEPDKVEDYEGQKSKLQEEIAFMKKEVEELKIKRKNIPRHIQFKELPQELQFDNLSTKGKYFIDTIKMIAYRSETSMADILRDKMSHTDEARRLLQTLYTSEVDIIPDKENKTLTVRLHHLANHCSDEILSYLCDNLNETETVFPDTDFKLIYQLSL